MVELQVDPAVAVRVELAHLLGEAATAAPRAAVLTPAAAALAALAADSAAPVARKAVSVATAVFRTCFAVVALQVGAPSGVAAGSTTGALLTDEQVYISAAGRRRWGCALTLQASILIQLLHDRCCPLGLAANKLGCAISQGERIQHGTELAQQLAALWVAATQLRTAVLAVLRGSPQVHAARQSPGLSLPSRRSLGGRLSNHIRRVK